MTDTQDIPDFRKGKLMNIAYALGLTDDGDALRAQIAAGLPFDEEFVQPIQARLNAELAKTAVREAEALELREQMDINAAERAQVERLDLAASDLAQVEQLDGQ
jgi:hypothetical protein